MAWKALFLALLHDVAATRLSNPTLMWRMSADEELPGIYGEHLFDDGSCEVFRNTIPAEDRRWGVAGLPNTGTNALYHMMTRNCDAPGLWQVPWGKHFFLNASDEKSLFPLVLVKDPVQWFGSTCRMPYFTVNLPSKPTQCPSPLVESWGTLGDTDFDNLFELWTRWNGEYLRTDMPRMMLRFEDLLFAPKATISAACACVGGTVREPFQVLESKPKWGPGHLVVSNRSETLQLIARKRLMQEQVLTDADWALMNSTDREHLLQHFQYPASAAKGSGELSMILSVPSDILSLGDWGDGEF